MYEVVDKDTDLTQGDIVDGCQILEWQRTDSGDRKWRAVESVERVIILAQACDVANPTISKLLVGHVHSAEKLVADKVLAGAMIRDQIRKHRRFRWYFLPSAEGFPESVIDLRDVFSAPRQMLEQLAADGHRVCRLVTPYREHLAQHFSVTYSRIGLPEPYGTE